MNQKQSDKRGRETRAGLPANVLETHSFLNFWDYLPDIFWGLDLKSMRFCFVSPAIKARLGYNVEEVLGRLFQDFMSPASYRCLIGTLNDEHSRQKSHVFEERKTYDLEIELYHKNGQPLWFGTSLAFVRNERGLVYRIVGSMRDVTDRVKRECIRRQSEASYRAVFENAGTAVAIIEEDMTISMVNREFEILSGYSPQEIQWRMSLPQFVSENQRLRAIQYHCLRRTGTPLVPRTYETKFVGRSGKVVPVLFAEALIPRTKKSVLSILDLTNIKQAEEAFFTQRAYFRQLFENSPQGILILNTDGRIVDANKGVKALFQFEVEELIGQIDQHAILPDDRIEENEAMRQSVLSGQVLQKETVRKRKDGSQVNVSVLLYSIRIDNRVEGLFCIYQDITARKTFEAQLHRQAFHDALTAIPNRALFMERLGRALKRMRRREEYSFAVLMVDLDSFKSVNDRFGHFSGDNLLIEIASRFQTCIRALDTVARLGGDEFAVLVEEFLDPGDVEDIAQRLLQAAQIPFRIENHNVEVNASVGVVLNTQTYKSADEILRDADIAMYRAKEEGKACYKIFDRKMLEQRIEFLEIEYELRNAIHNNELVLYYQPIMDVQTKLLKGFEALVRWQHPEQGMLSPEKFIPVAEESGLISQIGEWVVREACRQMAEWQKLGDVGRQVAVNVNISLKHFMQPNIVDYILAVLNEYQLEAQRLKIELTESILMEDSAAVLNNLQQLKAMGVQLVVDDFGTGYSSLSYLQQLPIDHLKIDRSFVHRLGVDEESFIIVKAIIDMARNLGFQVVAEGVEKEHQLEQLRQLACDNAQGFLFSKPVDALAAEMLLHQHSSAFHRSGSAQYIESNLTGNLEHRNNLLLE